MGDGVEQSCWPLSKLGFGDKIWTVHAHPSCAYGVAMGSGDAQISPRPPLEQVPEALGENSPLICCGMWG